MQLKFDKENYGTLFLVAATLLIWSLIIILFNVYGYQETWELWSVPAAKEVFLDLYTITGSAESFRHGFEPTIANPYEPGKRVFNYPDFWRLFFYSGITLDDTIWIGISINILFFIGVFLFPEKISISAAIAMLFVLFSPASMLLYERGNVDLIVFFICAMVVFSTSYSANIAALLIALGTIVKLFPFFGVSVLLKEPKHKFWLLFAGCFLVLAVYMVTTDTLNTTWNLTMRADEKSYGTNVFVAHYEVAIKNMFSQWLSPAQLNWLLKYGSLAVGLVLLVVIVIIAFMNTQPTETSAGRNFAAFRMGASIYVGTFMLGNNWDYRLAFLVLAVPQLLEWTRSLNKTSRFVAQLSMISLYLSCWHFIFWFSSYFNASPARLNAIYIFDEFMNWILMAGLAYLLVVSLPDWLKAQVGSFLPKRILTLHHEHDKSHRSIS